MASTYVTCTGANEVALWSVSDIIQSITSTNVSWDHLLVVSNLCLISVKDAIGGFRGIRKANTT